MLFSFPFSPFVVGSRGVGSRGVIRLPRRTLAFGFAFTFALVAPPSSIGLKLDLAEFLAISRGVIAIGVEGTFCGVSAQTVLSKLLACL